MAIQERQVRNKRTASGELTGKPGTVYDVNIKYKSGGITKTYSKKGFRTKKEAQEHEAAMHNKLAAPSYTPLSASQRKLTVQEYMDTWIEQYSTANLRPATTAGYKNNIKNHINPALGSVPLCQLNAAMLDKLYAQLTEKGLSASSIRYVHRVLSVSLECARKYHYIESNPAKDILTKFGKANPTPDPYTVTQMRELLDKAAGTDWEMLIVLSGLYGLRLSEALGLRWVNVDLSKMTLAVVEQLPQDLPKGTLQVSEMAPVKSCERVLPITAPTLRYFKNQLAIQQSRRDQLGEDYIDNDLVVARPDGSPKCRSGISSHFSELLQKLEMPRIRFHDLRHSAATNMHELTGDFFTAGEILGHSLKGIGYQLNIPTQAGAVTAGYVSVRLDRKKVVLDAYHNAVFAQPQ